MPETLSPSPPMSSSPSVPSSRPPPLGSELCLDVEGFEGPLRSLLDGVQRQKIKIERVDVSWLAGLYLSWLGAGQTQGQTPGQTQGQTPGQTPGISIQLEAAAEHLGMTVWLAWYKSCYFLHLETLEEGEALDDASLAVLDAARRDHIALLAGLRARWFDPPPPGSVSLRRVVAPPSPAVSGAADVSRVDLHGLLAAYAAVVGRKVQKKRHGEEPRLYSLSEALHDLQAFLEGVSKHDAWDLWTAVPMAPDRRQDGPLFRRSAIAATFMAALELTRRGKMTLRQGPVSDSIQARRTAP